MIKNLIKRSPSKIKRPISNIYYRIPDYFRYGKEFRKNYKFLKESQFWSEKKLEEYQLNQLKKLIKHAYETVPYYTKLFNNNNIKVSDINSFNDLKKIPYLTKEIIQDNLEDLISNKYNKQKIDYVTTGGSTGTPMGFYIDKKYDFEREWAFIANMWERVGYNVKSDNRMIILRGDIPENSFYEYKNNKLILSSFSIEKNINEYINLIENYEPDFIQAYPSAIIIISNYINSNNIKIKLKKLKAIICGSENINENQRKDIEQAFNTRVYTFYGHTEHSCIGGECEKSNFYHLNSEYGYTEIIDKNGFEVKTEDKVGELVVTGFNNYVVPFIRYKTSDMAVVTNKKCTCGRNYRLIKKIEGRKQEYFVNSMNERVIFTWADYPLWQCKDKIWSYQYIQNNPGEVELNIHFKDNNEIYDLKKIEEAFKKYYKNIKININIVNNINRTKRGKFKYIIQNIKV
ncbi:MAG: phenylacetate--CoA ligase family protein [Clostridium perfringens]|nr:phenylacetate--CoA ligase family protein [Clostridium perfringens]MDU6175742.1 phenylacetate--CoA ligase family protein [Clostridium perfringens]